MHDTIRRPHLDTFWETQILGIDITVLSEGVRNSHVQRMIIKYLVYVTSSSNSSCSELSHYLLPNQSASASSH